MNYLFEIEQPEEERVASAIELLRSKGYLVKEPLISKVEVNSIKKLVYYFYHSLEKHNPGMKTSYNLAYKKDAAVAKEFLKARIDAGCSEERAYIECCELIDVLFTHQDKLGLNSPVSSITVLRQGEAAWITTKLLDIYNERNLQIEEECNQRYFDNLCEQMANKPLPQEEHEQCLVELEGILENYGAKKE